MGRLDAISGPCGPSVSTTSTLMLNGSQRQVCRAGDSPVGLHLHRGGWGVMGETGEAKGKGHPLGFPVHHRYSRVSTERVSWAAGLVLFLRIELNLHIVPIGQAPEEREQTGCSAPCSRILEECCKEAPALPCLGRHFSGHVTPERSPRLHTQIRSSRRQLLWSLDGALLALPGVPACLGSPPACHAWPRGGPFPPPFSLQLGHVPYRDLWCPRLPFEYGRLTTAPLLGGNGITLTSAANCLPRYNRKAQGLRVSV